jgi:hypothetical protein
MANQDADQRDPENPMKTGQKQPIYVNKNLNVPLVV